MSGFSEATVGRLRTLLAVPSLPARYAPVAEIGRGGMGVVWQARDLLLEREVAIKVLAEHVDDAGAAERLRREARILAGLEHPGIVAVHDAGVLEDGRPWYAMRLVRGRRLDVAAPGLTRGDQIRVMARLAEAIAFAHECGVIHRDLTPRNVMLGPFGEVLVLDWGVALLASRELTSGEGPERGVVLGTPGYMSPEQAAGEGVDRRSDVHGLGAILRDLLAAKGDRVPAPLASIRDRALAANRDARYPDALALRDDLLRFQDGEAVAAHRETVPERVGRWVARYRTPIVLVLAYLAMRLAVLIMRGI